MEWSRSGMEWSWTVGMGYFSLLVMMLTMLPLPLPVFSDNVTTSDALALLAFKSTADTNSRLRYTTTSVRYHCWWRGVQCSSGPRGRVIRFVLEGVGLKGTIGEHTLTLLDQLRVLSLKNNSLTGPIPDLSSLHNLKALFLSHNSFVGSFPPSILSLRRIQTVDLSHNNISGIIPTAAGSVMQNLHCFLVQNNRLWGSLPPFNQSTIKIFNVSTNAFSGPVPVTLFLLGLDSSALSANPDLCGRVVHRECAHYGYFFKLHPPSVSSSVASASPTEAMADDGGMLQNSMIPTTTTTATAAEVSTGGNKRPGKHKKRTSLVAGFMVFIALAFGIFGLLLTMRKKRHKPINKSFSPEKSAAAATDVTASRWEDDDDVDACNQNLMTKEEREREGERYIQDGELAAATSISEQKVRKLGKSGCLVFCAGEASMYSLEQLMKASAEMLGRGKIGSTYKAILDNRLIVSVKRLDASKLGITAKETFDRHMDTIGKLRHPNLISLRAYFQAKEERLLVYDYQSNGSLYSLIHGTLLSFFFCLVLCLCA
ncbi:putative inactive receptor kinase [Zostera marina]|uniref:Putative inactive receptor kinase n=1 Tax=Zostera marina TaxID=29655 RepID=A0A0K9NY09_ZOSMR|nr:putative inactive receptor kinase [Zostera marina]